MLIDRLLRNLAVIPADSEFWHTLPARMENLLFPREVLSAI